MSTFAKKHILKIKPYVPGKPIEEVQRDLGLKDVVKLASNENPYGPSPAIFKAMVHAAKTVNRYPDSSCYYLREELAKRLGVRKDQLIFGNGSDEIIILTVRAFAGVGDEIVVAYPSFLIYEIASQVCGARIRRVPLKNFRYDLEGMAKAVNKRTKIVFIGNPDNPASTYIPQKDLVRFLKKVPRRVLVFVDEAYFEYVTNKDYADTIKLLKRFKNVIVTRTFSKMYGLAGLRIGYGIADEQVTNALNRIREPFNINSIAQAAALACLKDKAYYRKLAGKIQRQKECLIRSIKKMGLPYVESYTNFILIDTKRDSKKISLELMKKGIIVRDMKSWGFRTFIRVTVGKANENKRFINALGEIL